MPSVNWKRIIFKTIADVSPHLFAFILSLLLTLSRRQRRYVIQVADVLITTEASKTLSAMYRHTVGAPRPKAASDTFREAPWVTDDLRIPLCEYLAQQAFAIAEAEDVPRLAFLSAELRYAWLLRIGVTPVQPMRWIMAGSNGIG